MVTVTDYAIVQRDQNNVATVRFCGKTPLNMSNTALIIGRVYTENENLTVVPATRCTITENGWEVVLTVPAGGLYTFEALLCPCETKDPCGGSRIAIVRHFGVGDLYVMAGQSNMSGYGRDVVEDPITLGVHLYKNNGTWDIASHPLNDSTDSIYPENYECESTVSPALSFARMLQGKLHIPIGLVAAALGGSTLSQWHPQEDGTLYRGMVRRLAVVGNVKGVLWYQGCSDASRGEDNATYYDRFEKMIELYRAEMGNVYFITAQLNRWAGNRNKSAVEMEAQDRGWGLVRDAQRRLAMEVEGVCVAPTLDLSSLSDGIHNGAGANLIIGQRMALAALRCVYGIMGQYAPTPLRATYSDTTHLCVHFDEEFYLYPLDDAADGMDVEDQNGITPCKKAIGRNHTLYIETERPYTLPAVFHAYWRVEPPSFVARDRIGQPMLSCYNMPIEEEKR